MNRRRLLAFCTFWILFFASVVETCVVRFNIDRRETILEGKEFGLVGEYEIITGTVEFALLPRSPVNELIIDLELARCNENGEVEFSADFFS